MFDRDPSQGDVDVLDRPSTAGRGAGVQHGDVEQYLRQQQNKDLLRFITCGSVDDGKSTLIGRLLYDCQLLFEDQLAKLEADSIRHGTTTEEPDMALLVDGLQAEREQGITIDVAYRYFTTEKRKFVVADTPGHEQYTRNMATGASTSEVAVLLVDARYGVQTQTRRHAYIVSLLGIRHVILVVNKMDLIDYDQDAFEAIAQDFRDFVRQLDIPDVACIPVSALKGDNVSGRTTRMLWWNGPSLLERLETVDVADDAVDRPFRMPVQWVNRPNLDFRGYAGTIEGGRVSVGDPVTVLPSGKTSVIERIVTMDGDHRQARAGDAVTLTFADEIDVSRGDVIAVTGNEPVVADQFHAHLVWMDETEMLPGRPYLIHTGTSFIGGQVSRIKHTVNVNTLEETAADQLDLNDVAAVDVALDRPVPFDAYAENPVTGAFIVIDRMTNATVAAGMIDHPLRRATNVHWHDTKIDKTARARLKGQTPCVLWFTGLSGAGKSTVADRVEQRLADMGKHTMMLDGDNVRHGLNHDLGFTDADRVENIRRVAETSKLMTDAGLITLVSFISPFREERRMAREKLPEDEFIEVFVDAPLAVCEQRDPKGLYQKARAGEIPNFTGIGSSYEPPENPDVHLRSDQSDIDELAGQVIGILEERGML